MAKASGTPTMHVTRVATREIATESEILEVSVLIFRVPLWRRGGDQR